MVDNEKVWDLSLQIKTCGRDESGADQYHHPYEPTPYCVLERLADSVFFGKDDVVLDYGCGKGRVGFFLSHRTKAKTIGIEYDEHIYAGALENQKTAKAKADFVLTRAEEYEVPADVNGAISSTPFPLRFCIRSWPGSSSPITKTQGRYSCFSTTRRTSTFLA